MSTAATRSSSRYRADDGDAQRSKGLWLWIALGVVLDQHFRRLKEANEALSKSELRGKQALAGASQAVWEWDISTDAVYFSPEWKALLGFAETELEDRLSEWETRIHPEDLPRVRAQLDTHLRGGQGE